MKNYEEWWRRQFSWSSMRRRLVDRVQRQMNYGASALFVAPFFFAVAAAGNSRPWLALTVLTWIFGQIFSGLLLFFGGDPEPPPKGAIRFQLLGFGPWIVLPLLWSAIPTIGLLWLVLAMCAWSQSLLFLSGGRGETLRERAETSDCRLDAIVVVSLYGFVGLILGLILLIRAFHPLA